MGKECSILTDKEFEGSRRALEAKRKSLRRRGKGEKVNAAEPLTEQDEECLWQLNSKVTSANFSQRAEATIDRLCRGAPADDRWQAFRVGA